MLRHVLKAAAIILIVVLLYSLLFGKLNLFLSLLFDKPAARFEDFAEHQDSFMDLGVFLRSYYTENGYSGRIDFRFFDGALEFGGKVIFVEDLAPQISAAQNKKLAQGKIEEDMIVFLADDEAKPYGLLYSKRPIRSLITMNKRYRSGVDSIKLDRYWYEIGVVLGAR